MIVMRVFIFLDDLILRTLPPNPRGLVKYDDLLLMGLSKR